MTPAPVEVSEDDWTIARAEAESIVTRWAPKHMTAREGLVNDITCSLIIARRLERDKAAERDRVAELREREAIQRELYALAKASSAGMHRTDCGCDDCKLYVAIADLVSARSGKP